LSAHAVTDETIYEYVPDDDAWRESDRSTDSVIGFSYGETTYAVTEQGLPRGERRGVADANARCQGRDGDCDPTTRVRFSTQRCR